MGGSIDGCGQTAQVMSYWRCSYAVDWRVDGKRGKEGGSVVWNARMPAVLRFELGMSDASI